VTNTLIPVHLRIIGIGYSRRVVAGRYWILRVSRTVAFAGGPVEIVVGNRGLAAARVGLRGEVAENVVPVGPVAHVGIAHADFPPKTVICQRDGVALSIGDAGQQVTLVVLIGGGGIQGIRTRAGIIFRFHQPTKCIHFLDALMEVLVDVGGTQPGIAGAFGCAVGISNSCFPAQRIVGGGGMIHTCPQGSKIIAANPGNFTRQALIMD